MNQLHTLFNSNLLIKDNDLILYIRPEGYLWPDIWCIETEMYISHVYTNDEIYLYNRLVTSII